MLYTLWRWANPLLENRDGRHWLQIPCQVYATRQEAQADWDTLCKKRKVAYAILEVDAKLEDCKAGYLGSLWLSRSRPVAESSPVSQAEISAARGPMPAAMIQGRGL